MILLSRSGPKTRAAQDLVRELEEKGVIVATPQVDIANLPDLKQALQRLSQVMPPVKGCIQATMALRVGLAFVTAIEEMQAKNSQ